MAKSIYWSNFAREYAKDDIYWYFPKGGTVDTELFRQKFRVFQSFEGQNWTTSVQQKFLDSLHAAKLSEGLDRAGARIMKRVYENLGLCWVESNQPIKLTPLGRAYAKESGRSIVLDTQIWRYQFPNLLNDVDATKGINLFPHVVLAEIILSCDNFVSSQEFILFISRIKDGDQINQAIERIKNWRALSPVMQGRILAVIAKTKYLTIKQNSGFALAFHRCDLLLDQRTDQLSVGAANSSKLKEALDKYKNENVAIKFKDEPDTISFYGDLTRQPTLLEALDYYVDISDVKKAVDTFRSLPKEVRGKQTPEEFEREQFLERHLEDFLETRLNLIEPGLIKIGRQYATTVGPIDLLARSKKGELVVIELKKGRAADRVFGQICRYMGCMQSEQAEGSAQVRGYIVGREIDQKLKYAVKVVDVGVIGLQTFVFEGKKGEEGWLKMTSS